MEYQLARSIGLVHWIKTIERRTVSSILLWVNIALLGDKHSKLNVVKVVD